MEVMILTAIEDVKDTQRHQNRQLMNIISYLKVEDEEMDLPNDINLPLQTWLSSLNCRSVKNKALSIADLLTSRNIDILALTESWLGTSIDAQVLGELVPSGYDILHVARPNTRGGGVAVLFGERLVLNIIQSTKDGIFTQFEYMEYR